MRKTKPNKLLDANTAVESYLDALLQEATEVKPDNARLKVEVASESNVHILETALMAENKIIIEQVIDDPLLLDEPIVEKESNKQAADVERLEFPIQCLMFKVKGHLLSMPLIRMGSVIPWGDKLTQLPHSPSYFKGLLKHRDGNVRVADTASLMMNVISEQAQSDDFCPSHLLVFGGHDWAISCDALLDVVTLNEGDIKWHVGTHNRLSYGTIKSSLTLILNPDAITDKLLNSDNSFN